MALDLWHLYYTYADDESFIIVMCISNVQIFIDRPLSLWRMQNFGILAGKLLYKY